jgi:hypothetical protein
MGAPPVVMGLVLGQHRPQVPLAEDEHPAGDLGPDGEHEPFRISVRSRAAWRDLHGLDAGISQDRVKRRGELPGPVPDQEPEVRSAVPQVQHRLRICCTVHGPSGFAVIPGMCTLRLPASMMNRQYRRWRVTAQSTWKKSVASIVAAWVCRNFRQVVPVCRSGAGESSGP